MNIVEIRPLTPLDAKTSVRWRNDPAIWKYTRFRPDRTITLEEEEQWIAEVTARSDERRFAIVADGQYVGNIYLTSIRPDAAEYHIFIGERSAQGKGIARRASTLILDFARSVLGVKFVELYVDPKNTRAIQLYQSLGFRAAEPSEQTGTSMARMRIQVG